MNHHYWNKWCYMLLFPIRRSPIRVIILVVNVMQHMYATIDWIAFSAYQCLKSWHPINVKGPPLPWIQVWWYDKVCSKQKNIDFGNKHEDIKFNKGKIPNFCKLRFLVPCNASMLFINIPKTNKQTWKVNALCKKNIIVHKCYVYNK